MQSTGTLILFPDEVTLKGNSNIVLLTGVRDLLDPLAGTGELFVEPSTIPVGVANIHNVVSKGGGYDYAESVQWMAPFNSYGDAEYVPPAVPTGMAYLNAFSSFGSADGAVGEGAASTEALISKGGDYNYSFGEAYIQPVVAIGVWHDNTRERFDSRVILDQGVIPVLDHLVIFTSSGTAASYITGTKSYIQEVISAINVSSISASVASILGDIQSSASIHSISIGQVEDLPPLDTTSRTWVVNLDTGASGQYDNFGYIKYFTRDGICYGITEDGIYEIDGDDDMGADIDALIEIGRTNFSSPYKKTIENIYWGVSSTGEMIIKVEADASTYYYEARSYSEALKHHRVDLGLGNIGNYYNLTLMNQDGADFESADIHFELINTSRKI